MFENRVLRRMFGSKRDEVIGGLRNLHIMELHNTLFTKHNYRMSKSMRMAWACSMYWGRENAHQILVGNCKERDH
jgi:hypothetical protein